MTPAEAYGATADDVIVTGCIVVTPEEFNSENIDAILADKINHITRSFLETLRDAIALKKAGHM